ncbi:hypothetical protein Scep_019683 [Stephania cephalantha]|uniref:Uncharacterized protein n=1 Tax=Stephania cephalantha TaxID=152367 RepID=A0AAP0NN65_9MAGN
MQRCENETLARAKRRPIFLYRVHGQNDRRSCSIVKQKLGYGTISQFSLRNEITALHASLNLAALLHPSTLMTQRDDNPHPQSTFTIEDALNNQISIVVYLSRKESNRGTYKLVQGDPKYLGVGDELALGARVGDSVDLVEDREGPSVGPVGRDHWWELGDPKYDLVHPERAHTFISLSRRGINEDAPRDACRRGTRVESNMVDTSDQLAAKDSMDLDSGIDYGVLECVVSHSDTVGHGEKGIESIKLRGLDKWGNLWKVEDDDEEEKQQSCCGMLFGLDENWDEMGLRLMGLLLLGLPCQGSTLNYALKGRARHGPAKPRDGLGTVPGRSLRGLKQSRSVSRLKDEGVDTGYFPRANVCARPGQTRPYFGYPPQDPTSGAPNWPITWSSRWST